MDLASGFSDTFNLLGHLGLTLLGLVTKFVDFFDNMGPFLVY